MSIQISYMSDVLCVWAYVAEARLDQVRQDFGDAVALSYRFCPVFGATRHRVGEGWAKRGGAAGFGAHVRKVAADFPHVTVSEQVWDEVAPTTSVKAHEALCAVRRLVEDGEVDYAAQEPFGGRSLFEEAIWQVRCAFFRDARDISNRAVVLEVMEGVGLPVAAIEGLISSGEAIAEVCRDVELRDKYRIEGSPTLYMNEGRQKLYGNVGYRVIAANIRELLANPGQQASWC